MNPFLRKSPTPLSSIKLVHCHGKVLLFLCISGLGFSLPALPQINSTATPPPTIDRPDFSVKVARPNAPVRGDYDLTSDTQESDGSIRRLHGHVVVELWDSTLKADEAEFDED
ncbi:MAG TPA: hypothetical protein VEF06_07820, partial [Bryobacteraceae bacterium]|nr:hypothetical protein [Bryobacteraceae bacterium]